MDIVVTGAHGFVGLNVVRQLAGEGHRVLAIARRAPDAWVTASLANSSNRVTHRVADLERPGELAAALAGDRVDAVIHAAVVTATTDDVERADALRVVAVNVGGTMQALDLARERGARRFVYVSSPAAIGPAAGSGRLDESVASNPTTLYGITKRASEQLVGRFAAIHGLSAVSVRIAQPYGPGERPTPSRVRTSPIYEWLAAAERGETLVTGPLTNGRDWTWVEDTARGIALLATDAHPRHDLYHLGVGRIATAGEVVELLRERFPELAVDERPDAPGLNPNIAGQRRPPLDCRRFRDEFGWSPATTIGEGLRRYSASSS